MVVAAALTLWLMFGLVIAGPHVGVSRRAIRIATGLLACELFLLLAWSYGTETCSEPSCAPVSHAFGVAARVDVPALAFVFVVAALARRARSGRPDTAAPRRVGQTPHP